MRRLLVFAFITVFTLASGSLFSTEIFAQSEEKLPEGVMQEVEQYRDAVQPIMVDDIPIPYDVLLYAQLAYQGQAVTQAQKFTMNGLTFYRLRVDQDSDPSDYDSVYLIYTHEWDLLRETHIAPPPPPPKPEPEPEPEKPKPEPGNEQDNDKPGRGGDDEPIEEEEKPEEDEPAPEEPEPSPEPST